MISEMKNVSSMNTAGHKGRLWGQKKGVKGLQRRQAARTAERTKQASGQRLGSGCWS